MPVEIRALEAEELETLVGWAAAEGWNPGCADAEAFRAAGADNFIGAFLDGELVSGISAVTYGDDFGFIGLYITRPDLRGQGYGRAVFEAGMSRLQNRTIGLDGVPEQQANYRSKGFNPDYGNTRYSGRFASGAAETGNVEPVTSDHLEALAAFDASHFPAPRAEFLECWLRLSHRSMVCFEDGTVRGFGSVRASADGFKIGPLFADDLSRASSLLPALAESCEGDIHIDVPDHQTGFIDLLVAGGMSPGFQTARMYRGDAPSIRLDGVFAVTSLELG